MLTSSIRKRSQAEPSQVTWKVQRLKLHPAVVLGAVGDMDTLVDGKAVDLTVLVIDVRPKWRDAIGAEGNGVRRTAIGIVI